MTTLSNTLNYSTEGFLDFLFGKSKPLDESTFKLIKESYKTYKKLYTDVYKKLQPEISKILEPFYTLSIIPNKILTEQDYIKLLSRINLKSDKPVFYDDLVSLEYNDDYVPTNKMDMMIEEVRLQKKLKEVDKLLKTKYPDTKYYKLTFIPIEDRADIKVSIYIPELKPSTESLDINNNSIIIEKFQAKHKHLSKDVNQLEKEMDQDDNGSSTEDLIKEPNYVFMYKNTLIGYVRIEPYHKGYTISNFIIKKEFRGKGRGTYCFDLLLDYIKKKKPSFISLWVYFNNDPARNIYYQAGFKPITTLLEGDILTSKSNDELQVEITSNKYILNSLREIYHKTNKVDKDMLPPNSALVLLDKDKLLAGCGYNKRTENNESHLTLFYPVGIDADSLDKFLDSACNHSPFKVKKFNILSYNNYQFFNVIKNYGKPKEEELILEL